MKRDKTYIEGLIQRFFDGTSSNIEEKELYEYFSGDNIAEELSEYQPVFQYFEWELKKELIGIEEEKPLLITKKKRVKPIGLLFVLVSIAASLLLLITFNSYPFNKFDVYEGSYVRVNGQVLDNVNIEMLKQLEQEILDQAHKREKKYQEIENNTNNKIEKYEELLQHID